MNTKEKVLFRIDLGSDEFRVMNCTGDTLYRAPLRHYSTSIKHKIFETSIKISNYETPMYLVRISKISKRITIYKDAERKRIVYKAKVLDTKCYIS